MVVEPAQPPDRPQAGSPKAGHQRHLSPCWRHFLEMLAAMAVGMIATGASCVTTVVAMLALMGDRRSQYSRPM